MKAGAVSMFGADGPLRGPHQKIFRILRNTNIAACKKSRRAL